MKKAIIAIFLICIIATGFVFATGSKEATASGAEIKSTSPNEKVYLRFSWWGSTTRHQATLDAIKLYQEKHPNVTIEGEYGAFGDYYQKLLTQLAGKTAPDIISVDYKWVSDLMGQGTQLLNIYDLEKYIDVSSIDMDFAKIYGGNDDYLIGIPMGVNGMGYLYNVEFLKKFGIEPNNEWTWETVIENGKKVHSQDPSKYLLYNNAEHWMYLVKTMLKQMTGNPIVLEDYSLGFEKADIVKVFSYVKELVDSGTVPPFNEGVLYENVYADQNPNWLNENFGIFPTSSSLIPGIANASNFEIASMRYPIMKDAKDPGILVTPSMFIGVYASSKAPDVAADFINFMINDKDAINILKDSRGIPCSKVAKDLLVEQGIIPVQVSDMVAQALTGAGVAESGPSLNPEIIALIKDFVQQVGYGSLTPEAAADGFIKEINTIISSIR